MDIKQLAKIISEHYEKTKRLPIGIKVNEEWLEHQMQQQFILRKESMNPLESFTGLEVQIDNTIETYEFVYRK